MKYNNDNNFNNKVFRGTLKDKPVNKIPKVYWKQKKIGLDSMGEKWFQIYECVMSGGEQNHLPPVYQLMIKFGAQQISMYFRDPYEAETARELLFYGFREFISDNPFKEAKQVLIKELKAWAAKTEAKINKNIHKGEEDKKVPKIA
jgi:hypothetical protein